MTRILKLIGMFAVIFVSPVSGVQLTFTKNRVIMGAPGETVMTCAIDETDIRDLYFIQVSVFSKMFPNSAEKTIALVDRNGIDDATKANLGDLANRVKIDGSIATNIRDSKITVAFDTEKLQCADAAYYQCTINYMTTALKPKTVAVNTTLEVYEYPVMGKLIVKHNGIEVNEGTSSRNPTFKVGDQIELSCSANVGSINTTLIQWKRTTEIGRENIWNEYQPSTAASNDGDAVRESCGYLRTATMFYNMTVADANRLNDLGFECYVRVSDPVYNNYVTPDSTNPKFYADVSGGNSGGNSQAVASAGASSVNVGAIVGGVVGGLVAIIIVVIIIWFLMLRPRRGGESYKTKEDSTAANRAPPIDTYSTVDKSKKYGKGGHANDALDEPHETRKPRDRDAERGRDRNGRDGRGKANYGMDRDDDDDDDYHSRDGSPTMGGPRGINHMGMDPVDGSIDKPGRNETRRKGVE